MYVNKNVTIHINRNIVSVDKKGVNNAHKFQ